MTTITLQPSQRSSCVNSQPQLRMDFMLEESELSQTSLDGLLDAGIILSSITFNTYVPP